MIREILQSSLFLSTNGAMFVASFCMLRKLTGAFYLPTCGLIPGMTSSFAGIVLERKSRRGLLALYMLNVALETVYNMLKSRGIISPVPCGEVMLFMLATSSIMYLHRNQQLPNGIIKKIVRLLLNDKAPDGAGIPESLEPQKAWIYQTAKVFAAGYLMKMVPSALMSLQRAYSKPKLLLNAMFNKNNAAFGAFLSSMVFLFRTFEYATYKIRRKKDSWNAFVAGGICGLSMLFQRNSTIALYMLSKVGETLYFKGVQNGYLPWHKYGDILIYTISTGLVFHVGTLEPHNLKPAYWTFMKRLTNGKFANIDRKYLDAFGLNSSLLQTMSKSLSLQKSKD